MDFPVESECYSPRPFANDSLRNNARKLKVFTLVSVPPVHRSNIPSTHQTGLRATGDLDIFFISPYLHSLCSFHAVPKNFCLCRACSCFVPLTFVCCRRHFFDFLSPALHNFYVLYFCLLLLLLFSACCLLPWVLSTRRFNCQASSFLWPPKGCIFWCVLCIASGYDIFMGVSH